MEESVNPRQNFEKINDEHCPAIHLLLLVTKGKSWICCSLCSKDGALRQSMVKKNLAKFDKMLKFYPGGRILSTCVDHVLNGKGQSSMPCLPFGVFYQVKDVRV